MFTPKGNISTEGETLQFSVLPYRCSICPPYLPQLRQRIVEAVAAIDRQMLQRVWQELDYMIDIFRVSKGGHIEHLQVRTETWSVSPSVDMIPFGVTIPASVPQSSETPEGLMNYPVHNFIYIYINYYLVKTILTTTYFNP
jgi:hypothetical protein